MKTLISSFSDVQRAADAMAALMDHGVAAESMDLVADSTYGEMLVKRKHNKHVDKATDGITTTTGADAAEGAKTGGVIGIAAGIVAGVASLIIPGFGIVVGGGALATAIAAAVGTGAAGAAAGGVTGFLKDMGAEEKVAVDMNDVIKNGGGVLSVTVSHSGETGVREILAKYRADHVIEAKQIARP
jgi:uncharacterized membrane protein